MKSARAALSFALSVPVCSLALAGPHDGDLAPHTVTYSHEQVQKMNLADVLATRGGCDDATVLSVNDDPEGDLVAAAAFSPDGSEMIVAYRDTKNILVFNATTRAFIREIPLSGSPADMAVSADGAWAVTANIVENTASIVDLATSTEVAVLPAGEGAALARITPDSSTAIVGSLVDGDLRVIDLATQTQLRQISGFPFYLTFSFGFESFVVDVRTANPMELANNSIAIFPDIDQEQIVFVDITTGATNAIPSANDPQRVDITPDGATAVVAHTGPARTLSVLDVATQTISKTIATPDDLRGPIAINHDGTAAATHVLNATRFVDLVTNASGPPLNTASVSDLITTFDGDYVLGVGFFGSILSFDFGTLVNNVNNAASGAVGAVSPVDHRAVLFSTTFGDDMIVVNTNGASGFQEFFGPSAPPGPEGDKPRTIAVSPDGAFVYSVNQFSDTVAKIDASSGTVLDYAGTGMRGGEIELTSNGDTAVVANRDDSFLSIIDTATMGVTNVNISRRGDQVEISPDDQYAYVAVIASGDGVWRVNLNTNSVDGAKLVTGNMGGVGFIANQFAGMTLSRDGSTLVTCNSVDDTITIIDTATWSVVTTVPVGDTPVRAEFSALDDFIFVANRDSDSISVVSNNGLSSAVVGTLVAGDTPYLMRASSDGDTLYVLNNTPQQVRVINLNTGLTDGLIALGASGAGMCLDEANGRLYVAVGTGSGSTAGGLTITESGSIAAISLDDNAVEEVYCTGLAATDLGCSADFTVFAVPSTVSDRVAIVSLEPECPGDLTTTGSAMGDPGFGTPDGVTNLSDLLFFVNAWNADLGSPTPNPGSLADVTTTGASMGDPGFGTPDGDVDLSDLLFFVNEWTVGLAECP